MPGQPIPCVGGPLDGHRIPERNSDGFLAADRTRGEAWLYKRLGERFVVCTDHDNSLIYPDGPTSGRRTFDPDRAWQAGEGTELDVIAISQDEPWPR